MTTIAITGADGFLGWHVRCHLLAHSPSTTVLPIGHAAFDDERLARAIGSADIVMHLAAVNSHDPNLASTNDAISTRLVTALDATGASPTIVIANSSHSSSDTAFGQEKRRVVERLRAWAERSGSHVSDVVLPNLFGECGRPRYNSVVATMCDALATGIAFDVDPDGRTSLLHAQEAAGVLHSVALSPIDETVVEGREIGVPELLERLTSNHATYSNSHEIPPLHDEFDLRLFNQLRVEIYRNRPVFRLTTHRDQRGSYSEIARSSGRAQVSISSTGPGFRRGEHFHFDKIERFSVVSGRARIRIRRLFSDQVDIIDVDGDDRVIVDIPTLHTHDLTNIGDTELLTLFWVNDHFDAERPDTYRERVDLTDAR